jgi:AraC-like DNA-binding protein
VASPANISAVLVVPLVRALEHVPGALDRFFAATDLTAPMVADPEARVSAAQFCVAWSEAVRLFGDPALALTIAQHTPAGAFGVVEYVCRSAPTVREALEQWVRYLGILDAAVEVGLVDAGDGVALRVLVESEAPAPASHELCFALVALHARRMTDGQCEPRRVRFTHAGPEGQAARYREFFGAPVEFDAEATELVYPRASLGLALSTADPNLLAILLPAAEELREKRAVSATMTDHARRALRVALCHDDAQLEGLARRLGMTVRSLQRRLRDEGTSFQALRDETRKALAERYLGEGHSLAEISFLLGFSEPSAFFRAFKRWTGSTPIARRGALQGAGAAG